MDPCQKISSLEARSDLSQDSNDAVSDGQASSMDDLVAPLIKFPVPANPYWQCVCWRNSWSKQPYIMLTPIEISSVFATLAGSTSTMSIFAQLVISHAVRPVHVGEWLKVEWNSWILELIWSLHANNDPERTKGGNGLTFAHRKRNVVKTFIHV